MFHSTEVRARGFIFFVIGTILLGLGAHSYSKADKFLDSAESALAVVVGLDSEDRLCLSPGSDAEHECSLYHPRVQFLTKDSKVINFSSKWGSAEREKFKVGDQFEILYAPQNPEDVRLEAPLAIYRYPLVLVLFGVLGSLLGCYFLVQLILRRNDIRALMEAGESVQGKIAGVVSLPRPLLARLLKGWGQDYFVEVAVERPEAPGAALKFLSTPFSQDPSERLKGMETLPVYFDPLFHERYYVDTSELPPPHALRDKQGRILPS